MKSKILKRIESKKKSKTESADLTIRLASPKDARGVLEIYAPFCRESAVSFETQPPTVDELRQRITKTLKFLPWLVCEQAGLIRGYAYASQHRERAAYRWSVDVSVYVREGHRRTGMGRALYSSLFAILRLQGYYNVLAGISLPNSASVALHESMGLRSLGVYQGIGFKCGAWHDVGWWQLPLRPRVGGPEETLAFSVIRDRPEFDNALTAGSALLVSR